MPVNPGSAPDIRLDSKEDNGSASDGSTEEKTNETFIPLRLTKPTSQKQGTLMGWLKTSKSSGHLKTDTTRDTGTDTEKQLGTDTKRDIATAPEATSGTATYPASEKVFHIPEGASGFTFRASSPLDGSLSDAKQPALNQDVRPLDFLTTASSPKFSTATLSEGAHSRRLSDETCQHHESTAAPSVGRKLPAAPSPFSGHGEAFSTNFSDRKFHFGPAPQCGGQVARPSGILDRKLIPDPSRFVDSACSDPVPSGPLAEGQKANKSLRSEMPVPSVESERTQSISTIRAEKQSPQTPRTFRRLSPASAASVRYNSAPSTVSSTPVPRIRLRSPSADEESENPQFDRFASSSPSPSTGPNTCVPSTGVQPPGSEEEDDYFDSSQPIKRESDSEDNSLALVLSSSPPDYDHESVSSALIRSPSPGGLNVIWRWTITDKRAKTSQAFFNIVEQLCRDLNQTETEDGYIYALKVKDPQAMDYVRIGVAKNIPRRIKNHEVCYGECERIYPPVGEKFVRVDHASRVEKLIHAELVEKAMWLEQCPRSRQTHGCHGEWFKVAERHAIAVIRKWSEWIGSAPYEEKDCLPAMHQRKSPSRRSASRDSLRAKSPNAKSPKPPPTTKWRLRRLEQSTLMKVCWPLDPWAAKRDDDAIDAVGRSMRRIAVS
jgi:hypothetical protein